MSERTEGVSVVVPAWNEEAGIAETLVRLKEALAAGGTAWEIVVVDDGSSDRTAEIAAAEGATVVRHAVNIGYGRSLQDGMQVARYALIATVDADATYPVKELPRLLGELEHCDMVVGARQGPAYHGSLFKSPARFAFRWLAEFASGTRIPDINSGFRIFRMEAAEPFLDTLPNGFSFPTTITLAFLFNGRGVKYVPIDYSARKGKSKIRIVRDTLRAAQAIVTSIVYYNPLKAFLLLAVACWLPALALAVAAVNEGGGVWALLAGDFFLAGVIVCALGLLAVRVGPRPGRRASSARSGAES